MHVPRIIVLFVLLVIIFACLSAVSSIFSIQPDEYYVLRLLTTLNRNKAQLVIMVFVISMLTAYATRIVFHMFAGKKITYPAIKIDDLAREFYYKVFQYLREGDFESLSDICTENMMHCFRGIRTEYDMPMTVDVKIIEYDQKEGIISVICTGFFADNSISKHEMVIARHKSSNYLLCDMRSM